MQNIKTKIWGYIKFLSKFAISFGIIGYMIYYDKLDIAIVKQGMSSGSFLIVSFLCLIGSASCAMYRWNVLLQGQKIVLGAWNTIRYCFIGVFFNTTMPGVVSGDIVKAWYVLNDLPKGQKKTPVLTAILLDRIFGLFGLIIVSSTALLLNFQSIWADPALRSVGLITLVLLSGVIFFFMYVMLNDWGPFAWVRHFMENRKDNKVISFALKVYDAWMVYQSQPKKLVGSLALSVCAHVLAVICVIACSRALGVEGVSVYMFFLIVPIGLLTTAIPIAPAGLGVGHAAFSALFTRAGSSLGAEIFTLFVTIQIMINLSGVFFYLQSPKPIQSLEEQTA